MMKTREQARRDIMRRCIKIIRDCRETIALAEWWADNRTDETPLDVEPEKVALFYALKVFDAAFYKADRIPDEWVESMEQALRS